MCGGGPRINRTKAPAAVINMPDFDRYDREFDLQKSAIDQQMNNSMTGLQDELVGVLRTQTELKEEIAASQKAKAERQDKLEEKAARLSVLMGPPPPEKTAQAPEIGVRDREIKTSKGKKALRIGRKVASTSGQGAGLNIT